MKTTFDIYYESIEKGDYISIRNFDNYINMLAGNYPESCGMSGICTCYFTIESDGSVYPCDFYVLDKYKLGNVIDNTFEELLRNKNAEQFVFESEYIDPKCSECKWMNLCRGGCRRYREPFVNNKPKLNVYCETYCDFFDYSYSKMEKIALMLHNKD